MMFGKKFGRYKAAVEEIVERRERPALRKQGEIGDTLGDIREVKGRDRSENVFPRSNGLRETLKLRVCVGNLGLPERKKEVYQ